MISLVVATRNPHKTREVQQILGPGFEVRDLSAYPEIPETIEAGKTFEENATRKALAVSQQCPGLVLADDSGLEVDALGGAPGIFSARYAGNNATDQQNIDKLVRELVAANAKEDQCRARFRCLIALARAGQIVGTFAGVIEGAIVDPPRGSHGFGYDPIFVPTGFDQTFAELGAELKNRISHRAQAMKKLAHYLKAI
jgi:XTP/dITP diphosphohydrolase